ncbi:hypothetical protein Stube_63920 [Streptomyces tubercidicus]|uniref:Uncharacterized protein n=1 Tax=Streptomyces tubercidicus TaxID=47759 RepID=A0A640V0L9_9ACTN|nr:hypothetical protein Stube_63920 [Streptomyces tubercidicus]
MRNTKLDDYRKVTGGPVIPVCPLAALPTGEAVRTHPVTVENGMIHVHRPAAEEGTAV